MSRGGKLDALFVGWENQENLGLRYIMAFLERGGYNTRLIAFAPGMDGEIIEAARASAPKLIGFSIIFQYNLREFGGLMTALRRAGVQAHFTAGGHYPSLCPETTLQELPALDSLVRFEGELTARELLANVDRPEMWSTILGLAFRRGDSVVVNPPRPLIDPLDTLPWPARGDHLQTARGLPMVPMLASRGCLFECSFCSIRQFYAGAPGRLRRSRSPEDVAEEMAFLYAQRGARLFLFQDDDFAAKTAAQRQWVERFLAALDHQHLSGNIGWKVSCRVDDVDIAMMSRCRERGLLVAYLGVESGNPTGLATLHKNATVERNLQAMRDLKEAGVEFDMGFMLLDPGSTLESIRANVKFLRQVAELGGPPISFVKMLPLAGTTIQKQLAAEGRLTGDPVRPDYRFLDPRLDHYALWMILRFSTRNSDPSGLIERLRAAFFDHLVARSFEGGTWTAEYGEAVRQLIKIANDSALNTLERSLDVLDGCLDAASVALQWPLLNQIAAADATVQAAVLGRLDEVLERFSPNLYAAIRQTQAATA